MENTHMKQFSIWNKAVLVNVINFESKAKSLHPVRGAAEYRHSGNKFCGQNETQVLTTNGNNNWAKKMSVITTKIHQSVTIQIENLNDTWYQRVRL